MVIKSGPFPFDRLPLELRQNIYKLLFPSDNPINISAKYKKHNKEEWYNSPRNYSILLVNRAIGAEVKEFLYRPQHFVFNGTTTLMSWLNTIGSCRKFLSRLTVSKSGHLLIPKCYKLLCDATRLQYLKITLPSSRHASLEDHIDAHWKDLSPYLLAHLSDHEECLRKLDCIEFDVGPASHAVTNSHGRPINEMTVELQDWCKARIRGHLWELFAKKKTEQAKASKGTSGFKVTTRVAMEEL